MVLRGVSKTKTRLSGSDERKRGQLVNTGRVKELCFRRWRTTRELRELTMQSLCVCDESARFRQADSGEGSHSSSGPGPAVSREEAAHLVVRGMRRV
jgi:hypothetical protein